MTRIQKSCNSVIEPISGGGGKGNRLIVVFLPLYRSILKFFVVLLRIILNFIPNQKFKHQLRFFRNKVLIGKYRYFNIEDYQKIKKTRYETYELNNKRITVAQNLYVSIFKDFSYIHDENKNILLESVPSKSVKEIQGSRIKNLKNAVFIDEAVNLTGICLSNYWHFTFMALDKIIEFEENGFSGKYLVFNYTYLNELLQLCQIPANKLIFVNPQEVYRVNKLHVIDGYGKYDIQSIIKIRNIITNKINKANLENYPKKLYVRRVGPYKRKVKNEDEVIALLKNYGYKMINPDDLSVEDQIKYFMAADIVITPHGANSTNALYMHEGSRFIECFGHTYIAPHMLEVIKNNKMFYQMLVEHNYYEKFIDTDYSLSLLLLEDTVYNL